MVWIRTRKTNNHLDKSLKCMVVDLIREASFVLGVKVMRELGEVEAVVTIKVTTNGKGSNRGVH